MQVKRVPHSTDAILEVFRELGLEDPEVRKHLRELAKSSDWYPLGKRQYTPQETRDNTLTDELGTNEPGIDAQLEPTA